MGRKWNATRSSRQTGEDLEVNKISKRRTIEDIFNIEGQVLGEDNDLLVR